MQVGRKRYDHRRDAGSEYSRHLRRLSGRRTRVRKPPNRLSYITIAEAFFARHLGGAFEPVGRDLEGTSHEIRAGEDILKHLGVI
jgi:hypothetical protein